MAERLAAWLTEVGAKYPVTNPNYDPVQAQREAERIRTQGIQQLERQAASFLREDYNANSNWWGSQTVD